MKDAEAGEWILFCPTALLPCDTLRTGFFPVPSPMLHKASPDTPFPPSPQSGLASDL
jgi:hypothetical protein